MKVIFYIIFLFFLDERCRQASSFSITDIDFQKHQDGFRVSIPDQEGISKVLTIAYLNQQCPALMDYITEAKNKSWTSNIPHKDPKGVSVIELEFLIEHKSEIYYKNMMVQSNEFAIEPTLSAEYMPRQRCNEVENVFGDCEVSETSLNGNQIPVYCTSKKVFEDDFNGPKLNTSIWTHDVRILLYRENEELVAFDDSDQNAFIENGVLHIRPTINEKANRGSFSFGTKCSNPCRDCGECQINRSSYTINPPVFSARIHTRNRFDFRYGKVEIRAKFPKGDWLFPYLLLQPKSAGLESLYPRQVKIGAARGNENLFNKTNEDIGGKRLFGGTLLWSESGEAIEMYHEKLAEKHYGDDFHIYSVLWTRTNVTMAVDGNVYGVIKKNLNFFTEEMYLVLGLTVGGFWNFPDENLQPGVKPYNNRDHRAALEFWKAKNSWSSTWNGNQDLQIDYIKIFSV